MSGILYINDMDVAELGLKPLDLSDWWGAPRVTRASASPYALAGAIPSVSGSYEPRRLTLALALESSSLAGRRSDVDDLHRQFQGLLEVRLGDDSTRVGYAVMEGMAAPQRHPGFFGNTWPQARVGPELVFYDVCKYDREPSLVPLSTTPFTVPMGTAPTAGIYTVYGSTSPVTLRARAYGGELLSDATMTFAALQGSSEAISVDMANHALTFYTDGAASSSVGISTKLTSGWFFGLDPADAPAVEVTAGSGELRYRRRWLS